MTVAQLRIQQAELPHAMPTAETIASFGRRREEACLHQRVHWHGLEPVLTLCNGHYLLIEDRAAEFSPAIPAMEPLVNLAYINPQPQFVPGDMLRRAQVGVIASVLVTLFAGLFAPQLIVLLVWLALSLTALAVMAARPGRWQFYSALAKAPVFAVHSPLGSVRQAGDFVALLSERIEGAEVVLPRGSQRLAAEFAELRRLRRCRLLSADDLVRARQQLQLRFRQGSP